MFCIHTKHQQMLTGELLVLINCISNWVKVCNSNVFKQYYITLKKRVHQFQLILILLIVALFTFPVIMPPSALEMLTRLNVEYPMLFKLTNHIRKRQTHCGVLEFVADEGKIYIPYWVRMHREQMLVKNVKLSNSNLICWWITF